MTQLFFTMWSNGTTAMNIRINQFGNLMNAFQRWINTQTNLPSERKIRTRSGVTDDLIDQRQSILLIFLESDDTKSFPHFQNLLNLERRVHVHAIIVYQGFNFDS